MNQDIVTPTTSPTAQTPALDYAQVHEELQSIVNATVEAFHGDFTADQRFLSLHPHIKNWLWIPYQYGTHLSALTPRFKNWAQAILDISRTTYRVTPTAYILTPTSLTEITLEAAQHRIREIPEPDYLVTDAQGYCLTRTSRHQEAKTMHQAVPGSTLVELREQATIEGTLYEPSHRN